MQAVIEQFQAFGTPPLPTLAPNQARMTPSVTDAVKTLLAKNGREPNEPNLAVSQRVIPGPAPQGILLRIYTPQGRTGALPVIVYYHGGGWVIAA